jgi:hypothetical protein
MAHGQHVASISAVTRVCRPNNKARETEMVAVRGEHPPDRLLPSRGGREGPVALQKLGRARVSAHEQIGAR